MRKQQTQAESHLHAFSLQLTHYLNDWIIEDTDKNNTLVYPKARISKLNFDNLANNQKQDESISRVQKVKQKKFQRELLLVTKDKSKNKNDKVEVCRIQFPIIQSRSQSSKDLLLPTIKGKNAILRESKQGLSIRKSEKKISITPSLRMPSSLLASSASMERHQKQMLQRVKRKRKKSGDNKNPEVNNVLKQSIEVQISQIKAVLMKELRNNRRSAQKDNKNKNMLNTNQFLKQHIKKQMCQADRQH